MCKGNVGIGIWYLIDILYNYRYVYVYVFYLSKNWWFVYSLLIWRLDIVEFVLMVFSRDLELDVDES